MGSRKRMQNSTPNPFRNLEKTNLGGVIFGCTDKTLDECLSEKLFGLPAQHMGYVKNIDLGLPLFLFNYSTRTLLGVYQAASPGQMNINPYGWTRDGSERTSYPAQVLISTLKNCRPLLENQFKPIIRGNYYSQNHFHFELDHAQANKLIVLFSTEVGATGRAGTWTALNPRPSRPQNRQSHGIVPSYALVCSNSSNKSNEHLTLTDPVPVTQVPESPKTNTVHIEAGGLQEKRLAEEDGVNDSSWLTSDYPSVLSQLMLEIQELKVFKHESIAKFEQLEQRLQESIDKTEGLQQRMDHASQQLMRCFEYP